MQGSNLLAATLVYAGATALVLVVVLSMLKKAVDTPTWVPVLTAIVAGPVITIGIMVANGVPLTTQNLAIAVLAGILAAAGNQGTQSVHEQAVLTERRRQIARMTDRG